MTVDLRVLRAGGARALNLRGHVNRRERVGLCLSPCLRYAAVGSEDRSLRLYDLRTGATAARLQVVGGS
jgi:hypothetical protein